MVCQRTTKIIKRQVIDWGNTCAITYLSEDLYAEYTKNCQSSTIQKLTKDLNRHLSKEDRGGK